jgi:hypothetical protein
MKGYVCKVYHDPATNGRYGCPEPGSATGYPKAACIRVSLRDQGMIRGVILLYK